MTKNESFGLVKVTMAFLIERFFVFLTEYWLCTAKNPNAICEIEQSKSFLFVPNTEKPHMHFDVPGIFLTYTKLHKFVNFQ